MCIYTDDVLVNRWKMEFYKDQFDSNVNITIPAEVPPVQCLPTEKRKGILSQQQKYRETFVICHRLAEIASEPGTSTYLSRKAALRKLLQLWEEDKEAEVLDKLEVSSLRVSW